MYICNSDTWKVEAKVYGYPFLHSEFKVSLNYVSPFVASTNRRRKIQKVFLRKLHRKKNVSYCRWRYWSASQGFTPTKMSVSKHGQFLQHLFSRIFLKQIHLFFYISLLSNSGRVPLYLEKEWQSFFFFLSLHKQRDLILCSSVTLFPMLFQASESVKN